MKYDLKLTSWSKKLLKIPMPVIFLLKIPNIWKLSQLKKILFFNFVLGFLGSATFSAMSAWHHPPIQRSSNLPQRLWPDSPRSDLLCLTEKYHFCWSSIIHKQFVNFSQKIIFVRVLLSQKSKHTFKVTPKYHFCRGSITPKHYPSNWTQNIIFVEVLLSRNLMSNLPNVCWQFFSTYFAGVRNLHDQLKVPANYSRGQARLRSLAISGRYSRFRKRLRRIWIGNRRQRASPRGHQTLRGDSGSARDRLLHADLLLPERLPVLRGHLQRGLRSSPSTQVRKEILIFVVKKDSESRLTWSLWDRFKQITFTQW